MRSCKKVYPESGALEPKGYRHALRLRRKWSPAAGAWQGSLTDVEPRHHPRLKLRRRAHGIGMTGRKRLRQRPVTWITPLTYLTSFRGAPAFINPILLTSGNTRHSTPRQLNPAIANAACMDRCHSCSICATIRRICLGGTRQLWLAARANADDSLGMEDHGDAGLGDAHEQIGPPGLAPGDWNSVPRPRNDGLHLFPNSGQSPRHVAMVILQALRRNDLPYLNHGCEVAIRFSSRSNPASKFTPGGMRTYLNDPSMPFYRILGDWDEMGSGGDLELEDAGIRAIQQIRLRRQGDKAWSTVTMDLVREEGCWFIERLWVDDKSAESHRTGKGKEPTRRPLTMAELFDEDRLEVMSCKYADYDPARLGGTGGEWLEEYPNPSLTPKAVALTCIISLRQNHDGGGDEGGELRREAPKNEGCERVIRFCSPTNVASTLTPAHFAQYLSEPWYAIFKEWDELAFHSEEITEDGKTADLVVLLRPQGEEEWTSVNWELSKCDGVWLTEKIWVVDV